MTESVALKANRGVRSSDADRERISTRLRDAAAEGRLTMDELEERLSGVYAARYADELAVLVADLPRADGPQATGTRAAGWLAVLAVAWTQLGADLALLVGRHGTGWTRRRFVVAAAVLLALLGVIASSVHGFGPEHHGFEDRPGF
jgi:hypothetical protein